MRSDPMLERYKVEFLRICSLQLRTPADREEFLRQYLGTLNEFLYERRSGEEIDELNQPDPSHAEWKRLTPFLAIWDDYAQSVLGFSFDDRQIRKVASACVEVFRNCRRLQQSPPVLDPDSPSEEVRSPTRRYWPRRRGQGSFSRPLAERTATLTSVCGTSSQVRGF